MLGPGRSRTFEHRGDRPSRRAVVGEGRWEDDMRRGCAVRRSPRDVRPSRDDRCAERGEALGDDGWVCYRPDPDDPKNLIKHFGGIVKTGPAEPPAAVRTRTRRSLRVPEDLGTFFHPAYAPQVSLPEVLRNGIAELLAHALVADYKRAVERWANVQVVAPMDLDPPRCGREHRWPK